MEAHQNAFVEGLSFSSSSPDDYVHLFSIVCCNLLILCEMSAILSEVIVSASCPFEFILSLHMCICLYCLSSKSKKFHMQIPTNIATFSEVSNRKKQDTGPKIAPLCFYTFSLIEVWVEFCEFFPPKCISGFRHEGLQEMKKEVDHSMNNT